MAVLFVKGFNKTAKMSASAKGKLYRGLEYGGLGTLAAVDAHQAYKAHKEGDKGGRNMALAGTGALGALMGATYLAHKK